MSQQTFQIADGNPQKISLISTVINGVDVEILAYGDDTGTHVVEFDSSGNELASLFDPSTPTFGQLIVFGDGRIGLEYDNTLADGVTTQYTTDIYDLRTTGLNINDSGLNDGKDKYFAGTQFNDTVVGENNVNNTYYYVGANTTGSGPTDSFTGGPAGWNIAIFADARSDYWISTQVENGGPNITTITSDGADPQQSGSLSVSNVELLVFGATSDPTPQNNTIDATSGTFVILGGNNAVTIEPGAIAEIDIAASGSASYTGAVTFATGAGTLVLDQSADFQATVSNFGAGDTIVLQDINFSSQETDVWTQTTTGVGAAGTLQIYNGATLVDTLNLAGTYSQNDFALTQNDGVDVVYTASQALTTVTITVETTSGFD